MDLALLITQIVLIVLKVNSLITMSWPAVFTPLYIYIAIWFISYLIYDSGWNK